MLLVCSMMMVFASCKEDEGELPTVTTADVSDITATTAVCGGEVTADNGSAVTARGVCWSTSANPTIAPR